jgi:hypothetical protein
MYPPIFINKFRWPANYPDPTSGGINIDVGGEAGIGMVLFTSKRFIKNRDKIQKGADQ